MLERYKIATNSTVAALLRQVSRLGCGLSMEPRTNTMWPPSSGVGRSSLARDH